ncbi:MAG: glycosyltransferase family 4 protein [Armatimonadetes bacterium]|nr:glycosyltransferase family 4 protein [Armatimonadota bacterium]
MRILLCNKFYRPVGGPEWMVYDMTRRFEEAGHTVIIFSMEHPDNWQSPYSKYFMPNVEYSEGTAYGLKRKIEEAFRIIYSFEARKRIELLIKDTKPDIAHLHNIYHQLSPSIIHALKKHNIPIVMSLHDYKLICPAIRMFVRDKVCDKCIGGRFYNAIRCRCVKDSLVYSLICCLEAYVHRILKVYNCVDLFISPSDFLREKMIKSGVPADKIITQHVAVELSQFKPSKNGGHILYMGRLTKEKGVLTLAKAAAKLPNVRFCFAGEGEARAEIESMIEQENINNIVLAGFKAGKDLINLIEDSLAVVVPSEWYENCPRTVLEGFACGKPVIGSRIGGIPELICEGVDGYLFEPGNYAELADKILELLSDEKRRVEMGLAGRRKMEEHFSPDAFYSGTLDIYRRVAGIQ